MYLLQICAWGFLFVFTVFFFFFFSASLIEKATE